MKCVLLLLFIYFHKCVHTQEQYVYNKNVDKHYKFHRTKQTWSNARLVCHNENATLAMPKDINEMNVMINYFNNNYPASTLDDLPQKDFMLIGFHDHFIENEYLTLQGESLQYYVHTWMAGQPDNSGHEDCGSVHRTGLLNDIRCNIPSVFMCQKDGKDDSMPRQLFITRTDDPAYKCSPNLNMCYKLHWNPRTWPDARAICSAEGGRLAIIRNKDVETFLVGMFNDPNQVVHYVFHANFALIGFHDLFEESQYVTVEDMPLHNYGYVNWLIGNPSNSNGVENCGAMNKSGHLNDVPCNVVGNFFCERYNGVDLRFLE